MNWSDHIPVEASNAKKDYLWPQIASLPYFRGLLRAVEARFYENIDLVPPVLDLGCGDGHFATLAFTSKLEVGVDPWRGPVENAAEAGGYRSVIQAKGDSIPFPNNYFASAVSNSVLEHIPGIDFVLKEMARVLKPGASFVFCVPNDRFLGSLSISNFFDHIHLVAIGDLYRRFFNTITRHHHCDPPDVWKDRLEKAGFECAKWWHYFSPSSLHVLEWGHYFGLPSLLTKKLFGKWILFPTRWNLLFTGKITRQAYMENAIQPEGTYTFYIAIKKNRE